MFDIETAIADWRKHMVAAGIGSPVPLAELEMHLRDEIERQVDSGVSEPIAFEVSVSHLGQPQALKTEFKKIERNIMKRNTSSRSLGSYAVTGMLLSFILQAAMELLRPDYSPVRNSLNEYLVGPFSFLGTAAACMLAATFLMLLVGLRLSVRPSGFLTVSCVLLAVVAVSVCASAIFPHDARAALEGGKADFARVGIINVLSEVRFYALLAAFLLTVPNAFKRDEKWRSLSRLTLFLGLLILVVQVGAMLAPWDSKGLVQRGMALVIVAWLLITALQLRKVMPSAPGPVS